MSRDWRLFWADIMECCAKIEPDTAGKTRQAFFADKLVFDAVVRSLELIGEAARHLPPEAIALTPSIEWKRIRRMRNVLAHVYFGIDNDVICDAITRDVPELRRTLERINLP